LREGRIRIREIPGRLSEEANIVGGEEVSEENFDTSNLGIVKTYDKEQKVFNVGGASIKSLIFKNDKTSETIDANSIVKDIKVLDKPANFGEQMEVEYQIDMNLKNKCKQ
jgi:hypothetical protein